MKERHRFGCMLVAIATWHGWSVFFFSKEGPCPCMIMEEGQFEDKAPV
jgi:hypothetical protein